MGNEPKILGISGHKQAGKNTLCNFVSGLVLSSIGAISAEDRVWYINENGELWISDLYGDKDGEGILDLNRKDREFVAFADEYIYPYVKIYSCADLLKTEVCMKILGLTYEQCYGTDADKNTLTNLRWENMPGVMTEIPDIEMPTIGFLDKNAEIEFVNGRLGEYYRKHSITGVIYHPSGPMTAREVLQFVGTEVFRKMYGNVWIDATLRQIKEEGSALSLICDLRFPNEVHGVLSAGGKVIRLTRDIYGGADAHESETALNPDKFDHNKFSAIIDNQNMGIDVQNENTYNVLHKWEWVQESKKIQC